MSEKSLKDIFPKLKEIEAFEEKSRNFLKKIGDSLEVIISDAIDSAVYTLFPRLNETRTSKDTNSPSRSLAIFWDYDNFPILKDEDLGFFYDQIVPQESSFQILTKKVFSLEEQISKRKKFLEQSGFKIITVPKTGKKNETDLEIFAHCIEFCSEMKEPSSILLITGDRDYVFLIRRITELGHDVSLICSDKNKIHPELRKRVPNVVDRNDLFIPKNYLKYDLKLESDSDIWTTKWKELKTIYPKEKDQYRLLINIYHKNNNTPIRNLILLELENSLKLA